MKKFLILSVLCHFFVTGFAQADRESSKPVNRIVEPTAVITNPASSMELFIDKVNAATIVKNQGQTGTCWCFSGTSLIESQFIKANNVQVDLSEMYTVRNIYFEKAKNYYLRQGKAQLSEGGLGHDVVRAIATYGAMPEKVFSGLPNGSNTYNHAELLTALKTYLDTLIVHQQNSANSSGEVENWKAYVNKILDTYIGNPPTDFKYEGKVYTPKSFAKDFLKFNADEYVNITSFTDHPYYSPFILSVPDNYSNGSYYNLPLAEMLELTKNTIKTGYTILWDADVSNNGFSQNNGVALNVPIGARISKDSSYNLPEGKNGVEIRQRLFENLTTQDDHLMHIVGLEKNKAGKSFFLVKNSWGAVGPYKGYINVSESYFAINTISLVVPKAALSQALLDKLNIK